LVVIATIGTRSMGVKVNPARNRTAVRLSLDQQ
jgi:hypothetical protein